MVQQVRNGRLVNATYSFPNDPALKQELLRVPHDSPVAGHFGMMKTFGLLRRKYHWQNMRRDVTNYVQACQVCQKTKAPKHKPFGLLQPLSLATQPWKSITMDFIVKLPKVKRHGNTYDSILVVVDRFTKMTSYIPCSERIKAPELLDRLEKHVFMKFV